MKKHELESIIGVALAVKLGANSLSYAIIKNENNNQFSKSTTKSNIFFDFMGSWQIILGCKSRVSRLGWRSRLQ